MIAGTVYHPQTVKDSDMLDHLTMTLTHIEGLYPGCGILLCGDFNRLNVKRLLNQFKLKQIVDKPTRGDRILDLVLTNLWHLYDSNGVQILPRLDYLTTMSSPSAPNLDPPPEKGLVGKW